MFGFSIINDNMSQNHGKLLRSYTIIDLLVLMIYKVNFM